MFKIIKNPDKKEYIKISQSVKKNDGYCPCMLTKNKDTKCLCKSFREQEAEGKCHCGRFIKIRTEECNL